MKSPHSFFASPSASATPISLLAWVNSGQLKHDSAQMDFQKDLADLQATALQNDDWGSPGGCFSFTFFDHEKTTSPDGILANIQHNQSETQLITEESSTESLPATALQGIDLSYFITPKGFRSFG